MRDVRAGVNDTTQRAAVKSLRSSFTGPPAVYLTLTLPIIVNIRRYIGLMLPRRDSNVVCRYNAPANIRPQQRDGVDKKTCHVFQSTTKASRSCYITGITSAGVETFIRVLTESL